MTKYSKSEYLRNVDENDILPDKELIWQESEMITESEQMIARYQQLNLGRAVL